MLAHQFKVVLVGSANVHQMGLSVQSQPLVVLLVTRASQLGPLSAAALTIAFVRRSSIQTVPRYA
ncbi:unnamed protein product [Penicillium bialowiezense]